MSAATALTGSYVRLEPLTRSHIPALLAAAAGDAELFRWTTIPQTLPEMTAYVETALRWAHQGSALPFATVRSGDNAVVGSTRFFLIERWAWPEGHPEGARTGPDGCEIGYTWVNSSAIRSAVNSEAKLLMLAHAFDTWGVRRVCFHTDVKNERSRRALLGIGAKFEGVLRAHRISSDLKARDSARYSIVAAEWPGVREHLRQRLAARGS